MAGLWPLFLGVFAAGFAAALFLKFPLTAASLLVASFLWIIWSMVQGMRKVERFFKGARGEERVSGILATLPDGYHVFNDFVACGKHVDHVVVGPGGGVCRRDEVLAREGDGRGGAHPAGRAAA